MKKLSLLFLALLKINFFVTAQAIKTPALNNYLGIYSSKKTPLKITISKNDTALTAQATGQSAFPLEAGGKDQFLYYKAGIELLFNPGRGEMTVNQGGELSLFTKDTFTPNAGVSQSPTFYQPEDMQADLEKFKNALIKTHPGLNSDQSAKQFKKTVNKLMLETSKPMEATEFYKVVLRMISSIHDDHTSVKAFNHLGDVIANQKWLPFQIYVKNKRIFLVNNLDNPKIPKGSEILAIDGHLSHEILSEILKHFSSESKSESSTLHKLGFSYFLLFGKIYPQIFGDKSSYTISYRKFNSKQIFSTQITPITGQNYIELQAKRYASLMPATDAFSFNIDKQGNYAILKINRFFKDSFNEPENIFPDYFKKCFRDITSNGIRNLIVDLRDNSGGKSSNAAYLLQYFINKSIIPAKNITTLGNDEDILKATSVRLKMDDEYGIVKQPNGTFKVTNADVFPELKKFDPIKADHFNGKLVVLINGGVISAGGVAAGLFKEYTNAIIVGSETSGLAGISNGKKIITIFGGLTETAINIPLLHTEYTINPIRQKRGTVPDYQVSNSIHDIVENRDAVLAFVVKNLLKIKAN